MADPNIIKTTGFLFPLNEDAEVALRVGNVDETTWLEVVDVPPMLKFSIRGPHLRKKLRENGFEAWPEGELSDDLLRSFLAGLKETRSEEAFFKDQIDLANRIISLMERAVIDRRSVWLNF